MLPIRRCLVAVALVLAVFQAAAVTAAAAMSATAALAGSTECCVKGSHPVGQCPLHRKTLPSSTCRLSCAAAGAGPIVLAAGAMRTEPVVMAEAAPVRAPFVAANTSILDTPDQFDTPPPRS